jgi:hypothetical protein
MSISSYISFINNIPQKDTIPFLNEELGKQGVKVIYEKHNKHTLDNPKYDRIMFSTFVRSCPFEYPGTIIKSTKGSTPYTVVSVSQSPPITRYAMSFIHKNFSNASIVNANDGTTVTIYYYNDKWVISTHRGFHVNNYNWFGEKNYEDVVGEVMSQYKLSYDDLNKDKCYTFGFNHNEFHPFMEGRLKDKSNIRAWFIRSVDLKKFNEGCSDYISYTENIGLPVQETVMFNSVDELLEKTKNAYSDYRDTGIVNYGYILNIGTKQYLVESSLMKNIRNIFYTNKFNKLESNFDRKKYIVLNAFLDSKQHEMFKVLFPQFLQEFRMFEEQIDVLVDAISEMVKPKEKEEKEEKDEKQKKVQYLANQIHGDLTKFITINLHKKEHVIDIIYSFIYNTKYTEKLYALMY